MSVYSNQSDDREPLDDDQFVQSDDDASSTSSEEDEYVPMMKRWPFADGYKRYPSAEFMAKNYSPPITKPKPLPERFLEQNKTQQALIATAEELIKKQVEALDKIEAELTKAETDVKNSRSWQNLDGKRALVTRLKKDFDEANNKRIQLTKDRDELVVKNTPIQKMLRMQEQMMQTYRDHNKILAESIRNLYPWVQPIEDMKTVIDFGEVLEARDFPNGQSQLWFAPGTSMQDLANSLRLGNTWDLYCGVTDGEPWIVLPTRLPKDPPALQA